MHAPRQPNRVQDGVRRTVRWIQTDPKSLFAQVVPLFDSTRVSQHWSPRRVVAPRSALGSDPDPLGAFPCFDEPLQGQA